MRGEEVFPGKSLLELRIRKRLLNLIEKESHGAINKYDKKLTLKKYNKSDLICDVKNSFYKYHDTKKLITIPLNKSMPSYCTCLVI